MHRAPQLEHELAGLRGLQAVLDGHVYQREQPGGLDQVELAIRGDEARDLVPDGTPGLLVADAGPEARLQSLLRSAHRAVDGTDGLDLVDRIRVLLAVERRRPARQVVIRSRQREGFGITG